MKFEKYKVVPFRDHANPVQCEERNAQFWGLFGIDEADDAYAVGDLQPHGDYERV